jgi:PAS domain S-box-containing protein
VAALVAVAVLPVLAFSGFMLMRYSVQQRDQYLLQLQATARAVSLAIDGQIQREQGIIRALIATRVLRHDDWQGVHEVASFAVADEPGAWVVLYNPSGQLIVSTNVPFGTPLPRTAVPQIIQQVIGTRQPVVSGLGTRQNDGLRFVGVFVPVIEDETVTHVVALALPPALIGEVLRERLVATRGIGAVIDQNGILVARTQGEVDLVGHSAAADLLTAIRGRDEGFYESRSPEGLMLRGAFARSPVTGWTVALGAEEEALHRPTRLALMRFGGGGAALLLAALALAVYQGRRIAGPMLTLGRVAQALGRGEPIPQQNLGFLEAQVTADAIRDAAAALRDRAAELSSVLDTAAEGIVVARDDGVIVSANHAALSMFGYDAADELIGRDLSVFMSKADAARHASYILAYHAGAAPRIIGVPGRELMALHRDGSTFPIDLSVSSFVSGGVRRLTGIIRDATDRKRAEAALRESEERLRSLVTASSNVIYRMSPDWGEMRQLDGRGFLSDSTPDDPAWLNKYVHPDDQPLVLATIGEAIRTKSVFELEHRVRVADGSLGWTMSRAVPLLDDDGEVREWFGAASDVTQRKQNEEALATSEARLRLAQEVGDAAYTDHDLRTPTIIVSEGYASIHGLAPGTADITYAQWIELICPEDRDRMRADIAWLHEHGGELASEFRIRRPSDGAIRWIDMRMEAFPGPDGRPQRTVSAQRDITDLKERAAALALANENLTGEISERMRAEAEVRRLNASLEARIAERTAELLAANKEMESFSYSVSHDLRAPLRAIEGFSRILLEDYGEKLDAEGRRLANVVRDSARRMAQMIDDILAFSRVGRAAMEAAPVNMQAEVRKAISDLAPVIEGREVDFEIGDLPSAQGDAAMLQHVWANLLGNSAKYTRPRDRAIIQIGAQIADGETVYFVRDNGVGFDMRYVDKLFGAFQRLHGAEFSGAGIGLSIVKRIVTRHGGRVWAEAEVDKGATFFFSLGGVRTATDTMDSVGSQAEPRTRGEPGRNPVAISARS